MNGFGGSWAKVDENEWLLSKSKIVKKTPRHKEYKKNLATNERELARIN